MRTLCKVVLALGAVALLTQAVSAQQPQGRGRGGMGMGLSQLLDNKDVQKELNLSDDQVEKAKKVAEDVVAKHRDELTKLRESFQPGTPPSEESRAKMQELQAQVRDETVKDLGDVLKPDQTKRLKQLVLQQQIQSPFGGGPAVLLSPDVAKQLNLTDKQKDDLKTMSDDYRSQMREAFQGGGGGNLEEARKKMQEMRKEAMDNAMKVLDDTQKKKWEDMTGKPFEFRFTGGRRGGGGAPPR